MSGQQKHQLKMLLQLICWGFFFREEIKEKYEDKLQKEMSGLEFEIVSKVFKAITGRKITVPGSFVRYLNSCTYRCISSTPISSTKLNLYGLNPT